MANSMRPRPRHVAAGVLAASAVALLSACGPDVTDVADGGKPAASATAAPPAAPTAAPPVSGAASPKPSTAGKVPTAAAPATAAPGNAAPPAAGADCTVDDLRITAENNTIDATEGVITVQLHNKGGRECRINGFPGADLKVAEGTISLPRRAEKAYPDQLAPGADAAFNIYFPVNTSGGSGVTPTRIVVTPPNDTHQVTLAWPGGSLPLDDPEHPDAGPKLEVGPAGKVG